MKNVFKFSFTRFAIHIRTIISEKVFCLCTSFSPRTSGSRPTSRRLPAAVLRQILRLFDFSSSCDDPGGHKIWFLLILPKNTAKSKHQKQIYVLVAPGIWLIWMKIFWKDWYWSILNFTAGGEGGNDRLPVGIYGFGTQSFCSVLGFYHFSARQFMYCSSLFFWPYSFFFYVSFHLLASHPA